MVQGLRVSGHLKFTITLPVQTHLLLRSKTDWHTLCMALLLKQDTQRRSVESWKQRWSVSRYSHSTCVRWHWFRDFGLCFGFPFLTPHRNTAGSSLAHKAFGFHSQAQRVHMLVEGLHAHTKILIYTLKDKEAARGAERILARLLLFIWLLRRKRSRNRSSDYLNFLTRRPADRLISHWVSAVCLQRAGLSGEGEVSHGGARSR